MYFPAGSRCTWVGEWNDANWSSPVQFIQDVTSYLENNAHMAVESSSFTTPDFFSMSNRYTVTLKLRTLIDRSDMEDVRLDANHAFYVAFDATPDASRVSDYTLAVKNTNPQTPPVYQPTQQTGAGKAPDSIPDNGNKPELSWWEKTKAQLQGAGVGVILGAVAVAGLVAFVIFEE